MQAIECNSQGIALRNFVNRSRHGVAQCVHSRGNYPFSNEGGQCNKEKREYFHKERALTRDAFEKKHGYQKQEADHEPAGINDPKHARND